MAKTKEAQKGRLIPYEDFDLKDFTIGQNKVTVTYKVIGIQDRSFSVPVTTKPHPDMQEKLDQMKVYMATRMGCLTGWDFATDNIKDLDLNKLALDGLNDAISRFKATGIIYIDKDERNAVQIRGSVKCPEGGSSRLDVPLIYFDEENSLSYADEVKQIAEECKKEVYNFLILNKKYQSDIEDQSEGFDNEGGAQMDLVTESEQADAPGGFDEKGERDFEPSQEQLDAISNEEE